MEILSNACGQHIIAFSRGVNTVSPKRPLQVYPCAKAINKWKKAVVPLINARKVLIIDDSATSCLLMARVLQKAGYQVVTAMNGQEGLMKAFRERPHCLVLDVVLPGGMSGFSLCRHLRAIDPHHSLPIIMVSTKNTPLDHSWALRQGADRYLTKPFTEALFLQTVEEVLAEHFV